jgi:hypothetical protein
MRWLQRISSPVTASQAASFTRRSLGLAPPPRGSVVPTHRSFKAKLIFNRPTPGASTFHRQSELCWGMGVVAGRYFLVIEVGTMFMIAVKMQ